MSFLTYYTLDRKSIKDRNVNILNEKIEENCNTDDNRFYCELVKLLDCILNEAE
ncbi:hypothetical protein [Acetobacterium wieringae]|uniref:hypothetical protein n=1 Tax=Acetobacterium wieringae TaxID=52694 RepID=UPI002033B42B|nr:hypothetical protein [Acetobacterium wieringae]URN83902.1 hypothetical protein CHL1_003063 [Acetobacterium wieringae]